MAKNGGKSFWDSLFDFNGDGKTDIGEEWLAFQLFQEVMKEEPENVDEPEDDPCEWRPDCEDGSKYGVSPFLYETQREYNEALWEAKQAFSEKHKYDWRMTCVESDYGIDPEDYETLEDYLSAAEERETDWEDHLSDDIREKLEQYCLDPFDFSSEEEMLDFLQDLDEAAEQQTERKPQPQIAASNVLLEKALETANKDCILEALMEGSRSGARLTIRAHISLDPSDGAGDKCIDVVECKRMNGTQALVYTSEEAAKQEIKDAGAYITGLQDCILLSLVRIPEIDGILIKSKTHGFRLCKQDMNDLLSNTETQETALDAISTHRIAWLDESI